MKVAITGHTSGIGKALFSYFESQGHSVIGFSRSNGFHLKHRSSTICRLAYECDVFINNAHYGYKQTEILLRLCKLWGEMANKRIICIGSTDSDHPRSASDAYSLQKASLDLAVTRVQNSKIKCAITILKLGATDTPMTSTRQGAKLDCSAVVRAVEHIINLGPSEWISSLSLIPRLEC